MAAPRYDVLGIGNAIVDVIARAEDDFLVAQGMHKGGMALIDEARAAAHLRGHGAGDRKSRAARPPTPSSASRASARARPSSARSRTTSSAASSRHDIRAAGVAFDTQAGRRRPVDRALLHPGDAGRRAHHEHLSRRRAGSAPQRHRRGGVADAGDHLSRRLSVGSAAGEGSLPSRRPRSRTSAGRTVALTLSDAFCVDRYRDEFLDLIRNGTVDIVFANEHELHSLYETADFDTAVKALQRGRQARGGDAQRKGLRGGRRATAWKRCRPCRSSRWSTPPAPAICSPPASWSGSRAARITRTAARLGALAAAEVIQHVGARPAVSLKALAAENGLALLGRVGR